MIPMEIRKIIVADHDDGMKVESRALGQRTCYIADPEGNLIEIGSFGKGES